MSGKRGTIVAAGIIQTGVYKTVKGTPEGKEEVHKELTEGLEVLIKNDVDLIICEVKIKEEYLALRMVILPKNFFSISTT